MSSEFNEYLEGSVTKWYENGKLESKGEYSNGSRTGKWCYWYENGNKKSEGHFLPAPNDENSSSLPRDYKIGKWIDWWENGFKSEEGKYSKKCSKYGLEKKIGIWKGWAEDGRLEYKEKYVRGKCLELYP
jgi:antitoxin component YwqK of YwqJK toxin-antitoxin module